MFYIKRNDTEFGPFSSNQVKSAFVDGKILKRDLIRHNDTNNFISLSQFFKINNIYLEQREESVLDIIPDLLKTNSVFLNPFQYLKDGIKDNMIIIYLLAIVLIPIVALFFSIVPFIAYVIYGFYFALIWGLILYKTIATPQVELNKTILIAVGTITFSFIFISLLHLSPLGNLINSLIDANSFILNAFGMFFGVAIIEEFSKQLFVFGTINFSKKITFTRTAIFYGMISGLAFGIFEGIEYQMSINKQLEIDQNYFYNIIRLTSLPFFHAIWAGIGAYFTSLSFIDIKYKYTFLIYSIVIPSILHASYNLFGLNIFGISVIIISAIFLIVYLTKSDNIGIELNKI